MPGFDRTGPRGQGPRTGGGFGYCGPGAGARPIDPAQTGQEAQTGQPDQNMVAYGPVGNAWGGGWGRGRGGGGWGGGRGRFCRRVAVPMAPVGAYGPPGGWRGGRNW